MSTTRAWIVGGFINQARHRLQRSALNRTDVSNREAGDTGASTGISALRRTRRRRNCYAALLAGELDRLGLMAEWSLGCRWRRAGRRPGLS